MADTENNLPPSKKRAAGREISRDNPGLDDEEQVPEQEIGTFKRASDEVLAGRRIVKVRRQQTSSNQAAPSSNPFAGIHLVPSSNSSSAASEAASEVHHEKESSEEDDGKNDMNKEAEDAKHENNQLLETKADEAGGESATDDKKPDTVNEGSTLELVNERAPEDAGLEEKVNEALLESADDKNPNTAGEEIKSKLMNEKALEEDQTAKEDSKDTEDAATVDKDKKGAEAASFSSFQQLSSSQNAFTGLTGTGFSSSTFSFGSLSKDGSQLGSGSILGLKNDQSSSPFSFGLSNSGSSLFGTTGAASNAKNEGSGFLSMQEVPVETGEENEKSVFSADSVLFEFIHGGWKERGKGEIKVNVPSDGTGKGRLVMRTKGNYRLVMNASLYPDMKLTNMDKKGITFACINYASEGKGGLSTFALKFKDASRVAEFHDAVTEHKGEIAAAVLKTPENSPKASDD